MERSTGARAAGGSTAHGRNARATTSKPTKSLCYPRRRPCTSQVAPRNWLRDRRMPSQWRGPP
eukprot:11160679-Lingulodinium_polyedra.AAC.1